MDSESETEEFYDAAEELSPTKGRANSSKKQPSVIEKDHNVSRGQENHKLAVSMPQPDRHEAVDCVDGKNELVASSSGSTEGQPVETDSVIANTNMQKDKTETITAENKLDQPVSDTWKVFETPKADDSPVPVAPPRRKRKQKKDSATKVQEAPVPGPSDATSVERQKPPRPPVPGEAEDVVKKPTSLDIGSEKTETLPSPTVKPARPPRPVMRPQHKSDSVGSKGEDSDTSEPRVRMNTDSRDMTQDMTRVLERGSSLDIVYNTDLAERKGTQSTEVEHASNGASTSTAQASLVPLNSVSGRPLSDIEILEQVEVKNLDTGETMPLSLAEEKIPQCTNPMALHLMRLTSEYSSNPSLSQVVEDGHLSDSSTTPSVKVEDKRKKLKKFLGKTVQKIRSVADEVKSRREESSSSDEEELQENTYIKFKSHRAIRDRIVFDKIRLLQDLSGEHLGAIWTMKFSICGRLLATAGQDNIVRIWVLRDAQPYFEDMRAKYSKTERSPSPTSSIASIASATSAEDDQSAEGSTETREDEADDLGPFRRTPFCSYHGHTSDVLDLSWSKNYFILSSSMDKTVRLWHISRHECLCCFQHVDFVTAICFHPRDDRYFLSGSLDGKIRLWNIPEKKVALWNEIDGSRTSLITAANFCQNGKLAVVGTYDGRCIFYDTERLKYHTQLTVRSTRGKNARGRKISGIEPLPGEDKVLVTSNDSRIRLYDLKDHSLYCKYKGGQNASSQIKAMFSHDGQYIICGSEDHFVYIWRTYHDVPNVRKDRNEYYESFSAHDSVVTAGIFAPVPSVIVPPPDGSERTDAEFTYRSEILVTADWSGGIKLFVNR